MTVRPVMFSHVHLRMIEAIIGMTMNGPMMIGVIKNPSDAQPGSAGFDFSSLGIWTK